MAPALSKPSLPQESKWARALRALPLLLILYGADRTFGTSLRLLEPLISTSGTQLILSPSVNVPFGSKYFGISGLDEFIGMVTAFFTPCIGGIDPVGRLQAIAFLADLLPLQVVWMVEGARGGNEGSAASRFRTAFILVAQLAGIGYVAPMYCFLSYIQSPLEKYEKVEEKRVKREKLRTILPSIGIAYVVPTVAMFAVPGLVNKQWINGVFFTPFPLYAAVLQRVFGRFVDGNVEESEGKEKESIKVKDGENNDDFIPLLLAYGLSAGASAVVYLYLWLFSPVSMKQIFFSNLSKPSAEHTMLYGAAKVLRYDQICCFGAGAVWTLLNFWDLKREGRLRAGWNKIIGVLAGTTLVCGPGAGIAVMWGWRESILRGRGGRGKEFGVFDSAPRFAE